MDDTNNVRLRIIEKIQSKNDGEHIEFALPNYIGKNLIAYQSMRGDILLCLDASQKLLSNNREYDDTIRGSLWRTIIALYGKCFIDATGSKSPKLEVKDCAFDEPILLETHNKLLQLRHNFVAHRGETDQDIGVSYLKLRLSDLKRSVWVSQHKRNSPDNADLENYIFLFKHLINVVESKFEKLAEKAWDHMLRTYTIEQLALLKISGPKK